MPNLVKRKQVEACLVLPAVGKTRILAGRGLVLALQIPIEQHASKGHGASAERLKHLDVFLPEETTLQASTWEKSKDKLLA